MLICTWNEWHEGTNIEPCREFGQDYLQLTRDWAGLFKHADLERPSTIGPKLNQTLTVDNGSVELIVHNNGDEAAFAVNILINFANASDFIVMNEIFVPVNSSCISLYVPLIHVNEILDLRVLFSGSGIVAVTSNSSYHSSYGKEHFTGNLEGIGPIREEGTGSKMHWIVPVLLVIALSIIVYSVIRFARKSTIRVFPSRQELLASSANLLNI